MSVFVGDIGVQFRLDAGIDISSKTILQIKYLKPDGVSGTWNASLFGTDYAIYTTVVGDLDVFGNWTLQIYVVTPVYTAHGKKARAFVSAPIE